MNEDPVVSVVIPSYNRPHLTIKSIRSALDQGYPRLEVIVVDDGSTDNTWEEISKVDDDRLRAYRHEKNRGANAARNTGINKADGTYIAFLDSDDVWDQSKTRKQVSFIESSAYDAIYCDVEHTYDSHLGLMKYHIGSKLTNTRWQKPEGGEELVPLILSGQLNMGGSSTLMITKDLLLKIGMFDEDFQRHQDWELMVRVAKSGTVGYLDEPLVRKQDTDNPGYDVHLRAKKQFLGKYADIVVKDELAGKKIIGEHHLGLAMLAIQEGRYSRAKHHLSMARTTDRTRYIFLFQAFLKRLLGH